MQVSSTEAPLEDSEIPLKEVTPANDESVLDDSSLPPSMVAAELSTSETKPNVALESSTKEDTNVSDEKAEEAASQPHAHTQLRFEAAAYVPTKPTEPLPMQQQPIPTMIPIMQPGTHPSVQQGFYPITFVPTMPGMVPMYMAALPPPPPPPPMSSAIYPQQQYHQLASSQASMVTGKGFVPLTNTSAHRNVRRASTTSPANKDNSRVLTKPLQMKFSSNLTPTTDASKGSYSKPACILVVGMPQVGVTSVCEQLIKELNQDGLYWEFFGGGDHLLPNDAGRKPAPWKVVDHVIDEFSKRLDELLKKFKESQKSGLPEERLRGIIIDKHCRGIEELFFVTSVLHKRGMLLHGVLGLDASSEVIAKHTGVTHDSAFIDKQKFYRGVLARVRETASVSGLWKGLEVTEDASIQDMATQLRQCVLGAASQNPHRQLVANLYSKQLRAIINASLYSYVMEKMLSLTGNTRYTQFPGISSYTPLHELNKSRHRFIDQCILRHKPEGTKFVLIYDEERMFLIPRHMRSVFEVPLESWVGVSLAKLGSFILDGELVRYTDDQELHKFLVMDVIVWCERGSTTNVITSSTTWKTRFEKLSENLSSESTGTFSANTQLIIVHQEVFTRMQANRALFTRPKYPTDGILFQAQGSRRDRPLWWRLPERVTLEFRIGKRIEVEGDLAVIHIPEVYDAYERCYVPFNEDRLLIPPRLIRQGVIFEGAIVTCYLDASLLKSGERVWIVRNRRHDIATSATLSYAEQVLESLNITAEDMRQVLGLSHKPQSSDLSFDGPLMKSAQNSLNLSKNPMGREVKSSLALGSPSGIDNVHIGTAADNLLHRYQLGVPEAVLEASALDNHAVSSDNSIPHASSHIRKHTNS